MSKENELIVFLHTDLDAAGCMLNIEFKYPTVEKKYFFTNYADIESKVNDISIYIKEHGNKHILCADVSFSDSPESLKLLTTLGHVSVIDHHIYCAGFWDEFTDSVNLIWDKNKSATLLCNEHLGNTGLNENLDKLTYLIDIYDIWQDQHVAFPLAQDLNEYFWQYSVTAFVDAVIVNGYKLPNDYLLKTAEIRAKLAQEMQDYENRKLIHRFGDITCAFVDSCFNQILIKEHQKGQNFVIGISSYGIIKVRINQKQPYSNEVLNKIRYALSGIKEFGHLHAFTYKIKSSYDKLMQETQRIVETITKLKEEK